jgi:hypothetical protein
MATAELPAAAGGLAQVMGLGVGEVLSLVSVGTDPVM